MVLREHLNSCGSQKLVGQPESCIAGQEDRGSSLDSFLVDFSDSNDIKFELSKEASNHFTESVSPDEGLHGEGEDSAVSGLIEVIGSQHHHHNDSGAVSPEVDNNLIKPAVLAVSDATSLEHEVTNSSELGAFLNAEDDGRLHDSYLQSLGVVYQEDVVVDPPHIHNDMACSTVGSVHLFELEHAIGLLKHFYFFQSPLVSRTDNEGEGLSTHAEHMSAEPPLKQIQSNLHIEPNTEVDCSHPH